MNPKRICAAAAGSVLLSCCALGTGEIRTILTQNPAWLQGRIHWERAPREVNPHLSAGAATVLYFGPDGQFGMLSGTVYKQNHMISVSQGDSESVYRGIWTATASGVHVVYELIFHDVRIAGEQVPGPEQTIDLSLEHGGKLPKVNRAEGLNLKGYEYEVNSAFSTESLASQFTFADHVRRAENSNAKPR